jgi:hypothetical protein
MGEAKSGKDTLIERPKIQAPGSSGIQAYLDPRGQCPSRVDHRVSGEVKLHRKKSETARATMNEFLGSILSFLVLSMTA